MLQQQVQRGSTPRPTILVVLAMLAACARGSGGASDSQANVEVGPEGGSLNFDELTLTVPAGALASRVTLSARHCPTPTARGAFGSWFEIAPSGLVFEKPIQIVIQAATPAGHALPALFTEKDGALESLFSAEQVSGAVVGYTRHLSPYGPGLMDWPYATGEAGFVEHNGVSVSVAGSAALWLVALAGHVHLATETPVDEIVTVSGLPPGETWVLYRVPALTPARLPISDTGVTTFTGGGASRFFLQPVRSTRVVHDECSCRGGSRASNGQCQVPGAETAIWSGSTKTCTLRVDLGDAVELTDGVTLDCANHTLHGPGSGTGVYWLGGIRAKVRNCVITGFAIGVQLARLTSLPDLMPGELPFILGDPGGSIINVQIPDSQRAIALTGSHDVVIRTSDLAVTSGDAVMLAYQATETRIVETSLHVNRPEQSGFSLMATDANGLQFHNSSTSGRGMGPFFWYLPDSPPTPGIEVTDSVIVNMVETGLSFLGDWSALPDLAARPLVSRNNIYGNAALKSGRQVESLGPLELSRDGVGNFWGRGHLPSGGYQPGPLFVAGVDSNNSAVIDSHPFCKASGWIPDGTLGSGQPCVCGTVRICTTDPATGGETCRDMPRQLDDACVSAGISPTAVVDAAPREGSTLTEFVFDASGSTSASGGTLRFTFDFDGDGNMDTLRQVEPIARHFFDAAFSGRPRVQVEDEATHGVAWADGPALDVVVAPPILSGANPPTYTVGGSRTVTLLGDGFLPGVTVTIVNLGVDAVVLERLSRSELVVEVPYIDELDREGCEFVARNIGSGQSAPLVWPASYPFPTMQIEATSDPVADEPVFYPFSYTFDLANGRPKRLRVTGEGLFAPGVLVARGLDDQAEERLPWHASGVFEFPNPGIFNGQLVAILFEYPADAIHPDGQRSATTTLKPVFRPATVDLVEPDVVVGNRTLTPTLRGTNLTRYNITTVEVEISSEHSDGSSGTARETLQPTTLTGDGTTLKLPELGLEHTAHPGYISYYVNQLLGDYPYEETSLAGGVTLKLAHLGDQPFGSRNHERVSQANGWKASKRVGTSVAIRRAHGGSVDVVLTTFTGVEMVCTTTIHPTGYNWVASRSIATWKGHGAKERRWDTRRFWPDSNFIQHQAVFENLPPGKYFYYDAYCYNPTSGREFDAATMSYFRTPPARSDTDQVQFLVLSDHADNAQETNYDFSDEHAGIKWQWSALKQSWVVQLAEGITRHGSADFGLISGDLIDEGGPKADLADGSPIAPGGCGGNDFGYLGRFYGIWEPVLSGIPIMAIAGNHDALVERSPDGLSFVKPNFYEMVDGPGDKTTDGTARWRRRQYFSFDWGNAHFQALPFVDDEYGMSEPHNLPGEVRTDMSEDARDAGLGWYSNSESAEYDWFRTNLANAQGAGWRFLFQHGDPWPYDSANYGGPYCGSLFSDYCSIANQLGADFGFAGHNDFGLRRHQPTNDAGRYFYYTFKTTSGTSVAHEGDHVHPGILHVRVRPDATIVSKLWYGEASESLCGNFCTTNDPEETCPRRGSDDSGLACFETNPPAFLTHEGTGEDVPVGALTDCLKLVSGIRDDCAFAVDRTKICETPEVLTYDITVTDQCPSARVCDLHSSVRFIEDRVPPIPCCQPDAADPLRCSDEPLNPHPTCAVTIEQCERRNIPTGCLWRQIIPIVRFGNVLQPDMLTECTPCGVHSSEGGRSAITLMLPTCGNSK